MGEWLACRNAGYRCDELKDLHLNKHYGNLQIYEEIGQPDPGGSQGHGKIYTHHTVQAQEWFFNRCRDPHCTLNAGNLHPGHMLFMSDISRKVAAARDIQNPVGLPHLELSPLIEADRAGRITYYNDAAIDAMVRYGSRGSLEEFFPADLTAILACIDKEDTGSIFRDVRMGIATYCIHITLSGKFRIRTPFRSQAAGSLICCPLCPGRQQVILI